jgi:hypothetical protein
MSDATPSFKLAKSATQKDNVFTNCGRAGARETPAKPAQKKLTRVPFTVSRLMEFCNRQELVNQTGHDVLEWPLVILKELVDNALDACEEAGIAPVISVVVKRGSIVVEDNGPGIPAKTIDGVLDYSVRVSSREAYTSPTRGAQGNALKTILPMSYVMDDRRGEDASGKTVIEAHGAAHHIAFAVDHIRQEPKIKHATKPSPVTCGTRITVRLPTTRVWGDYEVDVIEDNKARFLELAASYAWLNPHLSIRVSWGGEVKIDAKASNPAWAKWLPSWPTSPHWYNVSRFRRYMAAHIANRGNATVREFIGELRGLSSTAKQKAVLEEIGASHVSLHSFFGRRKPNSENIARLLAACRKHSKPVRPRPARHHRQGAFLPPHGGRGRRSQDVQIRADARRDGRHPAGGRVRVRGSPGRSHRGPRSEPESHHRRQLVARHQQPVPAARSRRRRHGCPLVRSLRQHRATRHRSAARRVRARGLQGQGQVGDHSRRRREDERRWRRRGMIDRAT